MKNTLQRFDWNLFTFVSEPTETEFWSWSPKQRFVFKRIYDVYMLLAMFWSFTFAFAVIYENMSMASVGVIVPSLTIQLPVVMIIIMISYATGSGLWLERVWDKLN